MPSKLTLILLWLAAALPIVAQSTSTVPPTLRPAGAQIIETVILPTAKSRMLVLWMASPRRVMATWVTAADLLYGDHWFGLTNLSLVDPVASKLINTIPVQPPEDSAERDGFAIPFFTYGGGYHVPAPNRDRKGKPAIVHLKDFTGEGLPAQFALFHHVVSGIAAGSVFG